MGVGGAGSWPYVAFSGVLANLPNAACLIDCRERNGGSWTGGP